MQEQVLRKRREQLKRHIRRNRIFSDGFAATSLLKRELGDRGYDVTGPAADGCRGDDVGVASWAEGVSKKGTVPFGEGRGDGKNLSCVWVSPGGHGPSNLGVAFTSK